MTKSRKLAISVAVALLFALLFAVAVPVHSVHNVNVAGAVTVQTREEWSNPYNGTYYAGLNTNQTGKAFRSDLSALITRTHTRLTTYNSGEYALQKVWPTTDINSNGQMVWFYTGTTTSPSNFGGSNGTTNREHVWAKRGNNGAFDSDAERNVGADAHHLRPTEVQLNSTRGDKWFDELKPGTSGVSIASQNGKTNYGTAPDGLCYTNSNYFYPAKGYRGATARILFYVETRWGDNYNLEFSDTYQHSNVKLIGIISTLMKWHLEEPPTEEEIFRNNEVAKIQGNRNPFIDHPEYAEMIYCHDGKSYNNKLQQTVATYGSYLDNSNPGGDIKPTPPPDIDDPVKAFEDGLQQIEAATTLKDRYNAILATVNAYNQMSATDQSTQQSNGNYAKMVAALNKYNEDIGKINDDFAEATDVAAQIVAYRVSLSFMAVVLLIVRGLFGR